MSTDATTTETGQRRLAAVLGSLMLVILLAALDQRTGCVLAQARVPAETNERKAALALLKAMVLRGRVVTAEPGREFAFVTEEGGREGTEWRYRLEPTAEGTRVTESYTVSWIPVWARVVDVPTNRARELRESMQHTLAQLQCAAELPSAD